MKKIDTLNFKTLNQKRIVRFFCLYPAPFNNYHFISTYIKTKDGDKG